jgi:acyl-CoA thioester hydrolase
MAERRRCHDGEARLLVHTSRQPIRWADMDMLDTSTTRPTSAISSRPGSNGVYGLQQPGKAYSGTGPVIVNASCTFLLPLVYPGDVEVRMYLGEPGRTSIGSHYELTMNGRKYAEGAAKMVWMDLSSGRSVAVPDAIAALVRDLK